MIIVKVVMLTVVVLELLVMDEDAVVLVVVTVAATIEVFCMQFIKMLMFTSKVLYIHVWDIKLYFHPFIRF